MAAFLQSKAIDFDCNTIKACHPLPRKNNTDKLAAIMRFVNRKKQIAVLKQGRQLKGTDVCINADKTERRNYQESTIHQKTK